MNGGRRAAALAVVLLAAWLAARAAPPSHESAGARPLAALRVATLAERILKLQAQEGLAVLGMRGRRASGTALRQFDEAVRAVGRPATPAELHESAAILALLAAEYRTWALKPPTRDNARKLGERAEEVEWVATKVARLAGEAGSPPAAVAAEDASRLAQHVARLALWRRWGIAGESSANALALAGVSLERRMAELRASPANTADTLAELQLAENQVSFLLASARRMGEGAADARELEFAAKASDNAYESLERLAALHGAAP